MLVWTVDLEQTQLIWIRSFKDKVVFVVRVSSICSPGIPQPLPLLTFTNCS